MLPTDLPVTKSVRHGTLVSEEGVTVELAVFVIEEREFVELCAVVGIFGTEELPFNCVGVVGAEELSSVEDTGRVGVVGAEELSGVEDIGRAAPQTRHV